MALGTSLRLTITAARRVQISNSPTEYAYDLLITQSGDAITTQDDNYIATNLRVVPK